MVSAISSALPSRNTWAKAITHSFYVTFVLLCTTAGHQRWSASVTLGSRQLQVLGSEAGWSVALGAVQSKSPPLQGWWHQSSRGLPSSRAPITCLETSPLPFTVSLAQLSTRGSCHLLGLLLPPFRGPRFNLDSHRSSSMALGIVGALHAHNVRNHLAAISESLMNFVDIDSLHFYL